MTGSLDLDALLSNRTPRREPVNGLPPDVAEARRRESNRRNARAAQLAKTALARVYPDAFRDLYEQAKAKVRAERGPLPGDEPEAAS